MQLSENTTHVIIIVILVITIILLGIHINQMKKAENYEACILGQAANTNSVQDMTEAGPNQVMNVEGINKQQAANIRDNEVYYGNASKSDFVGGDHIVGDNNKGVACNNS